MNVLIVESPGKVKAINKYLGSNYKVLASFGHIRDLPSKDGSVKPDDDFAMTWEVDGKSGKRSDAHRKWLKQKIGPDVEGLVARLVDMNFETGDPERLVTDGVPAGDEDLIFVVLAHELDDLADGGLAFAPKYGQSLRSRIAACAALARRLDRESLAATTEAYAGRYENMAWAAALQETKLEGFRIAPNLRTYLKLRRVNLRGGSVEVI